MIFIELFVSQNVDEENEEAAYNQHRELLTLAQGSHQEVKKKKRKHRYKIHIIM